LRSSFVADAITFFVSGSMIASLPKILSPLAEEDTAGNNQSTWADFKEGISFLVKEPPVFRVIIGMTAALFGGGTIIVLGRDFARNVTPRRRRRFLRHHHHARRRGVIGLVVLSLNEYRLVHLDLAFGIATAITGVGLTAASLVTTVPGAASWMFVMGMGAGAAYLMGLTHLHEYVSDELRGRVFAALFGLMRIGLFVAMALAVPLVNVFGWVNIWRLDNPTRVVLALGGVTIFLSGLVVIITLRSVFHRPTLGKETQDIINAANRARRTRLERRHTDAGKTAPSGDADE